MPQILVTGGCGYFGSHAWYTKQNYFSDGKAMG